MYACPSSGAVQNNPLYLEAFQAAGQEDESPDGKPVTGHEPDQLAGTGDAQIVPYDVQDTQCLVKPGFCDDQLLHALVG